MSSTPEAIRVYEVQRQVSRLQEADRLMLGMHRLLMTLEREASEDECPHGPCFGVLVRVLELITEAVSETLRSLDRDADTVAEEHP